MAIPSFNAGQKVPAADLQTLATALTPQLDTSIGTIATNFTLVGGRALTLAGGTLIFIDLIVTNTNLLTALSGDFSDVLMFTLDSPYWPDQAVITSMSTTHVTGSAAISTAGLVTVTSASDNVAASSNIHISIAYLNAT